MGNRRTCKGGRCEAFTSLDRLQKGPCCSSVKFTRLLPNHDGTFPLSRIWGLCFCVAPDAYGPAISHKGGGEK